MTIREFLVLVMVCLIWGLHFVVMKVTVENNADPLFYAALRMTIVALILSPKLKWHAGLMPIIIGAGLGYGALNYAFSFPAMGMTTASAAAIAFELYVPFSIILSVILFKDKIGPLRLLGIVLAFIGVAIIAAARPSEAAGPLFVLGVLLIACAAMSEAVGAVLVKMAKSVKPLELLAWFAVVGSVVLWPLSLLLEDNQFSALSGDTQKPFLLALAYSVILVSLVAHTSYYWLLQRLPIYIVSSTTLMNTLVAVTAGVLILGEPLNPAFLTGGIMTLLGVAIILWRNAPKTTTTEPPIL